MLRIGARQVLEAMPERWSVQQDPGGAGVFLHFEAEAAASFHEWPLGRLVGMTRFTSEHRFSPFWTRPAVGSRADEVRPETLWLLAQNGDGDCTLVVPLLDGVTRYSLRGGEQQLFVIGETGDAGVVGDGGCALFVGCGDDAYALLGWRTSSPAPARQGQAARRQAAAGLHRLVRLVHLGRVLQGCRARGRACRPTGRRQAAVAGPRRRLAMLAQRTKRRGSAHRPAAQSAFQRRLERARAGVQDALWHRALPGLACAARLLGGLCERALPGYGTRTVAREFGPGLLEQQPSWNVQPWGAQVGVPAAERFGAFYDDLHRSLAAQGVDGVKVDVQAMLESSLAGQGGPRRDACAHGPAGAGSLGEAALRLSPGQLHVVHVRVRVSCAGQQRDANVGRLLPAAP